MPERNEVVLQDTTIGDAAVLFSALGVLHRGDVFSGKNLPNLDYNYCGRGVEIHDPLMKAYTSTAKNV